jgi:hypothetical protein
MAKGGSDGAKAEIYIFYKHETPLESKKAVAPSLMFIAI